MLNDPHDSSEGQESTSTPSTATSETTTASKAPADLTPSSSEDSDNEEIVYPPFEEDATAASPESTAAPDLPSRSPETQTEDAVTLQGSKNPPTATRTNQPADNLPPAGNEEMEVQQEANPPC
ncbi:hypothetical protein MTO96_001241 [Rhipicephalus appendiculatus]